MADRIKPTLSGYVNYRGRGHFAFLMHRISGLGTLAFLTLHILTTSTVFFAPQWYQELVVIFRNPIVMIGEIIISFFVVYHGVNGLRIAYIDLFRPDLLEKQPAKKIMRAVLLLTILLWLPVVAIMGFNLLKYGFGLIGNG
jgi:succinate dehydrogenase / fumarate reductase cytochrome b subunit